MKKIPVVFIIAAVLGGGFFLVREIAAEKVPKKSQNIKYWTCGMHPRVRREGPGKCPICAMDLVPILRVKHAHGSISTNTHAGHDDHAPGRTVDAEIRLDPRAVHLARVKTTTVGYSKLSRSIRTVGRVDYSERRLSHVAAWTGGRVDRLFVDFTGSYVRRGQPLLQLYSPKLISSQEEYITLLKGSSGDGGVQKQFLGSVRRRLTLLGMTEQQILLLEKTHRVAAHTTIYSPISGTVIKKFVHEGMYFKEGQNLYDIADLSRVWVHADIYEYEMSLVRAGQRVRIDLPSRPEALYGVITFVDPFLNPVSRTVKVRASFSNPALMLKPNMYVNATISIPSGGQRLAIPRTAVLDTGVRKVVYVEREQGVYVLRRVQLGVLTGEMYPVMAGLKAGERVVTRGAFLIDSQSQLNGTSSSLLYGSADDVNKKPRVHNH